MLCSLKDFIEIVFYNRSVLWHNLQRLHNYCYEGASVMHVTASKFVTGIMRLFLLRKFEKAPLRNFVAGNAAGFE